MKCIFVVKMYQKAAHTSQKFSKKNQHWHNSHIRTTPPRPNFGLKKRGVYVEPLLKLAEIAETEASPAACGMFAQSPAERRIPVGVQCCFDLPNVIRKPYLLIFFFHKKMTIMIIMTTMIRI